jgi:hypothetical protein
MIKVLVAWCTLWNDVLGIGYISNRMQSLSVERFDLYILSAIVSRRDTFVLVHFIQRIWCASVDHAVDFFGGIRKEICTCSIAVASFVEGQSVARELGNVGLTDRTCADLLAIGV